MAKFALECPHCQTVNTVSFFDRIKGSIKCGNCGDEINIKANRLTSRVCPHCKNTILYDQAKKSNKCPACHKEIGEGLGRLVSFPCPQCSCIIQIDENADENASDTTCPVCD